MLGRCLHTIEGHTGGVAALALSQDGRILISGGWDKMIHLWDWRTGDSQHTLSGHIAAITCLALSPDGEMLASGSRDTTVKLWDWRTGIIHHSLDDPGAEKPRPISSLAFSPNGQRLYTGTNRGGTYIWNPKTGAKVRSLARYSSGLSYFAISPDGQLMAGAYVDLLKLFQLPADSPTDWGYQKYGFETGFPPIVAVAMSSNGQMLATGHHEGDICLWIVHLGRRLAHIKGHSGLVNALAFSPDDNFLASGGEDGLVKLWDLHSQAEIATLNGHSEYVEDVIFAPDGKTLFSGGGDKTIRVWDLN